MIRTLTQRAWLRWVLIFLFWTLVGLAFATQLFLTYSKLGNPVSWRFALSRSLADWYCVALLSLPALWLARHSRIEGESWHWRVILHLAGSGAFSLLWMVLRAGLEAAQTRQSDAPLSFQWAFQHALVEKFFFNVLIYWAIVSVSHAFHFYQRYHERELRTAELERGLTQAKLEALRMQLNPHFLFNTLNAISALIHKNAAGADRMLARLSDLLRLALEGASEQEVPLRQEVAFLRSYVEIEQIRFGSRLAVRLDVAEDTLDALVPNLVLQPLVENAIQHGVAPHARPGEIAIQARRNGDTLRLQVQDNGDGVPNPLALEEGVGLSNTRARLQQLYGPAHRLDFGNLEAGGFAVTLEIPFRLSPAAPPQSLHLFPA